MALVQGRPDSGFDILFLKTRDRRVTPFLNSRFGEMYPEFSPDGRWIAYISDKSGRSEVYVQPFPGPGGRWQISNEGGAEPLWSRNGKQLFYGRPNQVLAVDAQAGFSFSASKPRLLFERLASSTRIAGLWPPAAEEEDHVAILEAEREQFVK